MTHTVTELIKSAEQGDAQAQVELSMHYWKDKEDRNYKKAAEWAKTAADVGFDAGIYLMGIYFEQGIGVKKNYQTAFSLFLTAAEHDYPDAIMQVARYLWNGLGIERDLKQSIDWWMKAAGYANTSVLLFLGSIYVHGDGVEKNIEKALEFYRWAADLGDSKALDTVRKWERLQRYLSANDPNDAENQYALYEVWLQSGIFRDNDQALKVLKNSAELGLPNALFEVGLYYEYGGFKNFRSYKTTDYALAYSYYRQAAEQGQPNAQLRMARCCETGKANVTDQRFSPEGHDGTVCEVDLEKSIYWYELLLNNTNLMVPESSGRRSISREPSRIDHNNILRELVSKYRNHEEEFIKKFRFTCLERLVSTPEKIHNLDTYCMELFGEYFKNENIPDETAFNWLNQWIASAEYCGLSGLCRPDFDSDLRSRVIEEINHYLKFTLFRFKNPIKLLGWARSRHPKALESLLNSPQAVAVELITQSNSIEEALAKGKDLELEAQAKLAEYDAYIDSHADDEIDWDSVGDYEQQHHSLSDQAKNIRLSIANYVKQKYGISESIDYFRRLSDEGIAEADVVLLNYEKEVKGRGFNNSRIYSCKLS